MKWKRNLYFPQNESGGMMRETMIKHRVVLIVLDGWGIAPKGEHNAISLAKTPNFDKIQRDFGSIQICASGKCVGLTNGQMGNSEVGHLTIGSGRVIFQDLMRVHDEIASGRLARNRTLVQAIADARNHNSSLHLMGLLSDGGVHSHIQHLFALLKIASRANVPRIYIHVFLDGRDTGPRTGADFVATLQSELPSIGKIATVSGRYYAMDRDGRWDRTKSAYDAIVYAIGPRFDDPLSSIRTSYDQGVNDEFVPPRIIGNYQGVKDGDLIVFFNFRPDRARQLTRALTLSAREFGELFDRNEKRRPKRVNLVTMTNYDPKLKGAKPLIGRERVPQTLSDVLAKHSIRQLRIAETEKYAHVTYFFNGLVEKPKRFETRILVPSLKVNTYDSSPQMSAEEICDNSVRAIEENKYGFILINFANSDMVGHSAILDPTIRAVETVDSCLGSIMKTWYSLDKKYSLLITADHGNAEKLFDQDTKQPHTAHTSNPVPFCVVSRRWKVSESCNGIGGLIDVAPTVLKIMALQKPKSMTGKPLVLPI